MGLFLTDNLLEEIVDRTNSYSRRTINNARPLRKKNRINTWKSTNVDEMKNLSDCYFIWVFFIYQKFQITGVPKWGSEIICLNLR